MASQSFLLRKLMQARGGAEEAEGDSGGSDDVTQMNHTGSQMPSFDETTMVDSEPTTTLSNLEKGKQHLENIKHVIDDVSHKMKSKLKFLKLF